MPRQLTLGALSPEVRAAEDLALPFLDGVDALAVVTDALDVCAAHRCGMAVVGPKGAGKSEARAAAVRAFAEGEAAKEDADASYPARRVVCLTAPRATVAGASAHVAGDGGLTAGGRTRSGAAQRLPSYRAVVLALLGALLGAPPDDRVRGRRKTDQELVADAVETAHAQGVAVVVVEEAERMGPDGFTALRDFMADAAEADPGRRGGAATGTGPGAVQGGAIRAAGVGVLLIGTPDLRARLERSDEAGQRWASCVSVAPLGAGDLPDVYRAYFPAFAPAERAYDARYGAGAWRRLVIEKVAGTRPTVSLRLADHHAREYFRLLVRNTPPEAPVPTRETAGFDRDLFAFTAARANWHVPGMATPPDGSPAVGAALGLPGLAA